MPIRKSVQLNVLLFVLGFFAILSPIVLAVEESITLTTYYPSPYGVYGEMRLYPKASAICNSQQEGLMYYDNDPPSERGLRICVCKNPPCPPGGFDWMPATGYWAASPSNSNNIYNTNSGNVGIGTNNPASEKLQVVGNVYSTNFYKSGNLTAVNNALSLLNATQVGFGAGFTGNDSIGIGKNTAGDIGLSIVKNGVSAGSFSYDEAGGALNNIRVEGDGTTPVALATQDADIYVAAGKRGNFYVQTDPTGSSPKNRMFIRGSDGNVGIGTTSPGASLHILGSPTVVSDRTLLVLDGGGSRDAAVYLNAVGSDGVTANGIFESSAVGGHGGWTPEPEGIFLCAYKNNDINQKSRVRIIGNPITFEEGSVGIGAWNPTLGPLEMGSGAYCSAGGIWTDASSKTYKKDIAPLALDKALTVLRGLNPVTFRYKRSPDEQSVGFIAEDVPELVATKDRTGLSPMDIVAVLTKVVQQQEREIKDLKQEVGRLKKRL